MTDKKILFSPAQMVANRFASGTHQSYIYSVGSPETDKPTFGHQTGLRNGNNAYVSSFEDYCSLRNRAIKYEQIDEWAARINDLNNQIERITFNNFLSDAEKQKKIARRMDIIRFFKQKIVDTEIFLGLRCAANSKTR